MREAGLVLTHPTFLFGRISTFQPTNDTTIAN